MKEVINKVFLEIYNENNEVAKNQFDYDPSTELLSTGLDSLGFAILVARLEEELGFDPFIEMEVPVYPKTFIDFYNIYESRKEK